MASTKMSVVMVVVAAMAMMMSVQAQTGQTVDTSCIQSLMPCAAFLNATNTQKPTAACCGPLKQAFETQLKCICDIFQNPALASAANLNMTVALELPTRCGLKADPTICTKLGQGPASSPTAVPKASGSEAPPKAKDTAPAPGTGAASSVAPISSLVLLFVGLILY